jgi:capsular polysaccharide biosynthesis protein
MSQQPLTLRKSAQLVRRHKLLVTGVALAGLIVGGGISDLHPPLMNSTALIVVQTPTPNLSVTTEAVIAQSEPVLARAMPDISPAMTLSELADQVTAKSVTTSVISVTVKGRTAGQAESAANAVAKAYIAYISQRNSPGGRVTAQVVQAAVTAQGMTAVGQDALDGGIGLLAGALAGAIAAIVIGRRGRRLTELDDIANSIAVPVLAAVPVGRPSDPADWTRLLDGYVPGAVAAWRLRQALREIGVTDKADVRGGTVVVTALSMAEDRRALALGPQLASYAASAGIPTALVVGPQNVEATAALYTACTAARGTPAGGGLLRPVAGDVADVLVSDARLVVVSAVDSHLPEIPAHAATAQVTLLCVTAGFATPEQVARLASAGAANGGDVAGFLVADPDQADQTSGRIPGSSPRSSPGSSLGSSPGSSLGSPLGSPLGSSRAAGTVTDLPAVPHSSGTAVSFPDRGGSSSL